MVEGVQRESLWTVSVCVWEGEITVFEAECGFFLLSVCLGKGGKSWGTVVCCSGGLTLWFSVS